MNEELEKCFDNDIYEIVKCPNVPELKSILRAVCRVIGENNSS